MKELRTLGAIGLMILLFSCSKKDGLIQNEKTLLNNTSNITSAYPALADTLWDMITMDIHGDYINSINRIKNDSTHMSYNTVEQGSGYPNGGTTNPQALVKTSSARTGPYALAFELPKRNAGITYDQAEKDRFESYILQDATLASCTTQAHYSGFSLYIPSGYGKINGWFIIHQWHQSSPESPPISFQLDTGQYSRLMVVVNYGVSKSINHHEVRLVRKDNTSGDKFIDLPRNTWIDFIVRWKFDPVGTTGYVTVYRHDATASSSTLIFDYSGQVGWSAGGTSTGINEKFGIYRKADSVSNHSIIYDQLRVGNTYNSVRPWQ